MKRLYLIALFTLVCGAVPAQENGNRDAQNRIVRSPYETNRLFDNIFVGVAGGINLYFGEHDSQGKFGKRLAPALDIHVGKWFTPSIGARVGYTGLQAKGWTTAGTMYAKKQDGDWFQEKFGVSYLHADALWNFSNAVSGYKEERTWNFMPFAGVGWARSYGNDTHDNEIGFDVGLLNVVRLCKALDLTLEARCLLVNQRFDGVSGGRIGEGMLSVTAGLAYKFNRRGFTRVSKPQAVDFTPYLDRIRRLEENNNDLASKNTALSDENEKQHAAQGRSREEGRRIARSALLQDRQGHARQQGADEPRILCQERHEGRQGEDLHADRFGGQGHGQQGAEPASERTADGVCLRPAEEQIRHRARTPDQEGRRRYEQPFCRAGAEPRRHRGITPENDRFMSRTAATVTNETPSGAAHHLLAYLEEGRVRVYAPRRQSLWIMQQLPQAEEQRIETQLRELHRTGRRTAVVEVQLRRDEETFRVRVLCVRA